MDTIYRLRAVLIAALRAGDAHDGEQELFDELMVHKPQLLGLFNVGQRNQQEQREVESGKVTVNGRTLGINQDFARQVLFLAQHLDCSERYATELLHTVTTTNPNIAPLDAVEAAIAEFHERRRHLADCLKYILEAAESGAYARLYAFVTRELVPPQNVGGAQQTLAGKLFREIENADSLIGRMQTAKQNAISNTSVQGNNIVLGYDILTARLDSLRYERRTLASALFLLARLGTLTPPDITLLVDWLPAHPAHAMTYQLLTALLAMFDPAPPDSPIGRAQDALARDKTLLAHMGKKLAPAAGEWADKGLKSVVLLKWTLFLTEARHRDPALEARDGFRAEELETQVWDAVQGDAFVFLARSVRLIHPAAHASSAHITLPPQFDARELRPPPDFVPATLAAFETLLRSLIMHASSELRKIKQRQEDLVLASMRTDRRLFRGAAAASQPAPPADTAAPRNDIAVLFAFIGLLYSALPPERALQFWGAGPAPGAYASYQELAEASAGRLPAFLQWAVWSTQARDVDMATALYDMLAGLATGTQCAELAYNFLARGGAAEAGGFGGGGASAVSWQVIFGTLEGWAAQASAPRPQVAAVPQQGFGAWGSRAPAPAPPPAPQQLVLSAKDVLFAQAFLRLLATAVRHSVAVRLAIAGHASFRAVPSLMALIPLGVPLELKGALLDALAAFCEPGAGQAGVEICRSVWNLMERLEVIGVRAPTGTGWGVGSVKVNVKGLEMELEEVEAAHGLYPATLPFVRLLGTLLHTPKRVRLRDRVFDGASLDTIPEGLGTPYRLPGAGPYVAFVCDAVFKRIPEREYARPEERWALNDACLCFVERALAGWDVEALVSGAGADGSAVRMEHVAALAVHPGFELARRLLAGTQTPLQASLLSYLADGAAGFEKGLADDEPAFARTITRVLRIVLRVLEVQDVFLDVLVPLLGEFDSAQLVGKVPARSQFVRLDQAMAGDASVAAYVAYPAHAEVVLLAIRILAILSGSSAFTNLATLVERSEESERILSGFVGVLGAETMQDVGDAEDAAERATGAGAPDPDASFVEGEAEGGLDQAVRLAALDLLIQNTDARRPFPNVAHFLLFGTTKTGEQLLQDPHALGARRTCIHVILDLLNAGVPRIKDTDEDDAPQEQPLFATLPALAERCYAVVYQLCVHPRTTEFTMRYLRTREDFFARQLAVVPAKVPASGGEIEVVYEDGVRVASTVTALSAFLRVRSWILDLVALDLHALTNKGHVKGIADILDLLFGSQQIQGVQGWEDAFREYGQSSLRMIEIVQSLNFEWSDSLAGAVQPVQLEFLQLNLQTCFRTDTRGCEIVDRAALLELLANARRGLHAQGRIVTAAHLEQLNRETEYILRSCTVENNRREVRHATAAGFEAWRRLFDMTLTKCFTRLPHERRENMLFDVLHVLPEILQTAEVQDSSAVLLAEAILSAVTKLREDRQHQLVVQAASGDAEAGSLPAERLFAIMRAILDCLLENGRLELVRGNLYAALVNYLHLVSSSSSSTPDGLQALMKSERRSMSLAASVAQEDFMFSDRGSPAPSQFGGSQSAASALEAGSLSIVKAAAERLVAMVARDAIDGTEVWKTVAFMLLDSLVQVSRLEKQHAVLGALMRQGVLANFVRGLREDDLMLQHVLKPDPDDLNSLYVYEAKMSLLIRIAPTRTGAERLLESQLIPTLAHADFIDARPEADQAFIDHDSFLPSAIQRYHQLFTPALQVVAGLLATLGSSHKSAARQTLEFLSAHRDTIVILLKNDSDEMSLTAVEEIHLLVTLCTGVLPLVPKTELASTHAGFGGIHSAVLSFATRIFGANRGRWAESIRPQTDAEMLDASVYNSGYGNETKFGAQIRVKEQRLLQSVLSYIGAASQFAERDLTPILSPVTAVARDEKPTRFSASVPTIGETIETLHMLVDELQESLQIIRELDAEISAGDDVRIENIPELVDMDEAFVRSLDLRQKRALVCDALERLRASTKARAKSILTTLEMLLLLLWRHLQFYVQESPPSNDDYHPTMSFSTSLGASKSLAPGNAGMDAAAAGRRLAPVLDRLRGLDLEHLGGLSASGYVDIMGRRMRDVVGLNSDDEHDGMDS